MSFSRIIVFCLLLTSACFSVLPSDLVFTPYAEFPERGQTELGYQMTYYTIQSTTFDKGFYFNHSISKNIRFGTEFYENGNTQKIYHHFAYRLGEVFRETDYNLVFSGAINYLSEEVPTLNNGRIYDGSLTTTWVPNNDVRFHLTIARKIASEDFISLWALSYQKDWGHLSVEWDGSYLNFSSQFDIYNRLNFRSGITKDINDDTELLFKMAIGFIDFLPTLTIDNQSEEDEIEEEKISTIDASVGLKHIQEGLTFFYNGEYRKALKSYEIAVQFFPESAVVHERLGSIYYKLDEFEKAQIEWEKANVITPSKRLEKYILEAKEKGESLYE